MHYHVIDNSVGFPQGYNDDVFGSRHHAVMAARTRAEWIAALGGLRVESLVGAGRYLITTGRPRDAGRLITVESCDEEDCLAASYGSLLEP